MQPELQQAAPWAREVEPVVRAIIRRKLRVTLDPSDGRRENQNGLELFGDVWVKLLREPAGEGIRNVRAYAAVIAYHACSEYFREKYPARSSLRNRIHYFLTHHPAYAVWDREGEPVCGFALWREKMTEPAGPERLAALRPEVSAKQVERMTPADWDRLFDSLFETLGAPAPLDDLVNAVAPLVASADAVEAPKNDDEEDRRDALAEAPSPDLSPEARLRLRLQMQRLWIEILQLSPRQRAAYLLNPTDGDLEVFPENGAASIADIGRALALTAAQFDLIAPQAPGASDEEKFAALWNRLPLSDKLIARLLDATPQQVINLRKVARERLARQMKDFR